MRHPLILFLLKCLVIGLGLAAAASTSDGIIVDSSVDLILVSLCVGALNAILRPLLILFTLPFVILTFGLGLVVINALVILLAGQIIPGFTLETFWAAVWAAILVSVVSMVANLFFGGKTPGKSGNIRYAATVRGPDGKVRHISSGSAGDSRRRIDGRSKDEDVIDI